MDPIPVKDTFFYLILNRIDCELSGGGGGRGRVVHYKLIWLQANNSTNVAINKADLNNKKGDKFSIQGEGEERETFNSSKVVH